MLLITLISYIINLYELNNHKQTQITTRNLNEIFEIETKILELEMELHFELKLEMMFLTILQQYEMLQSLKLN